MTDISGPISSASDMDKLVWAEASDQFGAATTEIGYSDVTVKTINGVTYVVGTELDGDVNLWSYDPDTQGLTLLATHNGANQGVLDMNDPQLLSIDGKIVIVGGDESNRMLAYSYDPADGAATVENPNNLVEHTEVETLIGGTAALDETFTFTASNGQEYFLMQSANGYFDGGTFSFDGSGNLVFDHMVDATGTYRTDGVDVDNVLVGETRVTEYTEGFNVLDGAYTVDYHQVGDVVYEYVGGEDAHGAFHIVKWEVDPDTGQLSGSQVIYTDGTTVDDLVALGYTSQPYPTVSPVDGTSVPLDSASFPKGEYLNSLRDEAGLSAIDTPDGSIDAIDFENIRAINTFEAGGNHYMFVGTWAGGQDGAAIFEIDPST